MARCPDGVKLDEPAEGCRPVAVADAGAALAWLAAEHHVLLGIQGLAAANGWHARVWRLAQALNLLHWRRGLFRADLVSSRRALTAAEELGDLAAIAISARDLAYDHLR